MHWGLGQEAVLYQPLTDVFERVRIECWVLFARPELHSSQHSSQHSSVARALWQELAVQVVWSSSLVKAACVNGILLLITCLLARGRWVCLPLKHLDDVVLYNIMVMIQQQLQRLLS